MPTSGRVRTRGVLLGDTLLLGRLSASASSTVAVAVVTGSPGRTPSSLEPEDATRATHPPRPSRPISRRTPQPTTNQIQALLQVARDDRLDRPPDGTAHRRTPPTDSRLGHGDPWAGYGEPRPVRGPAGRVAPKCGWPLGEFGELRHRLLRIARESSGGMDTVITCAAQRTAPSPQFSRTPRQMNESSPMPPTVEPEKASDHEEPSVQSPTPAQPIRRPGNKPLASPLITP